MKYDINKLEGFTLSSVAEGYDAFLVDYFTQNSADILYIASDGVELARVADLLEYINPKLKVLRFPAWDTVPYDRVSPNVQIMAERIEVLSELAQNPNAKTPRVVVASVGAVLQKLPPKKIFINS